MTPACGLGPAEVDPTARAKAAKNASNRFMWTPSMAAQTEF
jgi:hypothetical protein